jgi:maltose alpha-D-glucosyltransferase/alpha-amylase
VWSDTDQRYAGVPIVFKDTERSNWTWDPVAEQYFWHRFFHHQPDLNFDNPQWSRRCSSDALLARHGRRRHASRRGALSRRARRDPVREPAGDPRVLKTIRGNSTERHRNRMLLAEANQWPSDVAPTSATATNATWRFISR